MSQVLWLGAAAGSAVLAGGIGFWFAKASTRRSQSRTAPTAEVENASATYEPLPMSQAPESARVQMALGAELDILDSAGNILLHTRVLDRIPRNAINLEDAKGVAISRAKQLAADLFRGSAGLPNKTVEIVFAPDIQQGLADGTLEIVNAIGDGSRAMARNVETGQIAGHARVLEGGRVRQLAAGAFQLLSIAVAQSHLDDISKNLKAIADEVEALRKYFDSKDKSNLLGTVEYLTGVVAKIQKMAAPETIRQEKQGELETISREVPAWIAQIKDESAALTARIAKELDQDTFGGTEATHKALKRHAEAAQTILDKRNLLLRVIALLKVCNAYLVPRDAERVPQFWADGLVVIDAGYRELTVKLRDQAYALLSHALWNKKETLDARRAEIVQATERLQVSAMQEQVAYEGFVNRIDLSIERLKTDDGKLHMAVSFDANSNVKAVALMTS
ncbi:hypothetical protein [Chitinasiproducens palmae]|uniref:Uncharacterized protein n=1 Tax=Chitinasiproducens palmae TaxID=1770053 RepID=A0A1H2PVI2_9BURK|nr:hypothetical protein [Chitinasiproducens palmae]SDV50854.1 hypothetical protein SAMN05216551_113169 [Chitinasiproducens palmae]